MATIKSGPSERELGKVFSKTLPLARFWAKRKTLPKVRFTLGSKSRLGEKELFGKQIEVTISQIMFNGTFVHFEGEIVLEKERVNVWGKYRKKWTRGIARGEINLK